MTRFLPALVAILTLSACTFGQPPVQEALNLPDPSSVNIEPATPSTPGSLWTDRQGALFFDHRAREVGDIVTVAIYEAASASKEAKTSTGRKSSASADLDKFFGLERNIATINKGIDPSALLSAGVENEFEGSGKTSRKEDLVATLTTQVVQVLPNGNLLIEGGKRVTVNNEAQYIKLAGIVRPADITADNIINSSKVLDARITYTGKGVISDKQRQGWLVRLFDWVWPL